MKKMILKAASAILALTMGVSLLCSCGAAPASQPDAQPTPAATPAAAEPAGAHEGEWSFTDSLGRTATFNGPLTMVAPSGKLAQQAIYAVAPDTIIGLSGKLSDAEKTYFPENFTQLPVFGTFYGKKANFNRESVLSAGPQVVIDVGTPKKNMAEDLDTLQEQLGVPVIFIEAELTSMGEAFRTLGELLDAPEQAAQLADYCDKVVKETADYAAQVPEDQKKTVYYGLMDTGLTTAAQGDLHAEVIDLVGGINVVPSDIGHSFVDVDMERLLNWDPDVILLAQGSVYETAAEDPVWSQLRAIQQGTFYEIPQGPYSWMDQPPAANRILGVRWLGNLLYPEIFAYDMIAETVDFYDLFYHVEITAEQAQQLMAGSTFKN